MLVTFEVSQPEMSASKLSVELNICDMLDTPERSG